MSEFFLGASPIVRLRCKNEAGALTAPSTLAVVVYDPSGAVAHTFAIGDLTLESTGVYRCPAFVAVSAGWWRVKATATGAVADVKWTRIHVMPDPT